MPQHTMKDMAGQRFTRLLVVSRAENDKRGNARWNCQCDCGSTTVSLGFTLRNGEAKSCGCLTTDQLIARITIHERSHTTEWWSWVHMFQRCENPNNVSYARYGGRGIKVCTRWQAFANFYADLGPKPARRYTIERINNDGDYEPGNCRWATVREQNHNTSRTHFVKYQGQRVSLTRAVEMSDSGITRGGVFSRLRRGWSVKRALDTPVDEGVWRNRKRP